MSQLFLFDVGQGDCILLKGESGDPLVVDCGATHPSKYYHIPSYIQSEVQEECALAITHLHSDHYNLLRGFKACRELFGRLHLPALPMTRPLSNLTLAMERFVMLACHFDYGGFAFLPRLLWGMKATAHKKGDEIREAGMSLMVRWPDLEHTTLRAKKVTREAARLLKEIEAIIEPLGELPFPIQDTPMPVERFLAYLTELPPSELPEARKEQIRGALGRVSSIYQYLANTLSLAFGSSENDDAQFLFLGDLPSGILDILELGETKLHCLKAAHHGTEFGKALESQSPHFILTSRNTMEYSRLRRIHPSYRRILQAPVLNTEFLGTCLIDVSKGCQCTLIRT